MEWAGVAGGGWLSVVPVAVGRSWVEKIFGLLTLPMQSKCTPNDITKREVVLPSVT